MTSQQHPNTKPVVIREVWAHNLESEFALIGTTISHYPFISMDTEFPGFVFEAAIDYSKPYYARPKLRPWDKYQLLKANVDSLNIIQVGLTLADANGNLPDFGGNRRFVWEFNFRDFDVTRDLQVPDSIEMLQQQGIDFHRNRIQGIDSARFAHLMINWRLVCNEAVTWVTFHSTYDFGYLVKILTGRPLPEKLNEFLRTIRKIFGNNVYDMKHLMKYCNGLQAFQRMKEVYFSKDGSAEVHSGVVYGLIGVY